MPKPPDGFLAVPSAGTGAPVLVLHAWWGLNDAMKAFCTRLSESGFLVFAPDLYHGKTADNPEDAEALAGPIFNEPAPARADVAAAARYLRERAGGKDHGIAVIGFSLGAFFALDLSAADPDVRSVVVFYGSRPGDYSGSSAAYLGHFAETDEFEPRPDVDKLEEALRRGKGSVTFHHYPGTGHWFFEPDRSAYHEPSAALAWDRTLAFLSRPFTKLP